MGKLTTDVLYDMLLEKKRANPNYEFNSLDLVDIGNVDAQYRELVYLGKIIEKNDVIGSFDLID